MTARFRAANRANAMVTTVVGTRPRVVYAGAGEWAGGRTVCRWLGVAMVARSRLGMHSVEWVDSVEGRAVHTNLV